MDARIKTVLQIIEASFHTPLSAKGVAERLGLGRSRFGHLFKQETGQPFKTHIREVRLMKAGSMLSDQTMRIKEVAGTVGYKYIPNFTRDFRKRFGKTPSQYRTELP